MYTWSTIMSSGCDLCDSKLSVGAGLCYLCCILDEETVRSLPWLPSHCCDYECEQCLGNHYYCRVWVKHCVAWVKHCVAWVNCHALAVAPDLLLNIHLMTALSVDVSMNVQLFDFYDDFHHQNGEINFLGGGCDLPLFDDGCGWFCVMVKSGTVEVMPLR